MKNSARSLRALFLGLISASLLFAYHPDTFISQNVSSESREVSNPEISVMNINNMVYWIHKSGGATWSGGSLNGVQADYPAHTGGLIFADGVLWGVKDNSYGADYPIRVGGSAYSHGMKAGRVIYNTGGTVAGSDDPDNNHVWRVRRDWESADLTDDAAIFYGTDSTVSDDEIQNVRDQYEYDWNNWPADWGAPFDDVNNDGQYNPDVDIPGYPGADQTIWIISNDIPRIVDGSGNEINYWTNPIYGSDPVGIELRITLWAYNVDHDSPLGNVVFKKAGITYTGFNDGEGFIAPEVLDTVYFSQWSDPDLGEYTDDFVGCDIDLSMGFVYNGDNHDNVFTEIFGMSIPAGGYDFLQGPVDVDDIDSDGNTTEFLPMTSFSYFASGYSISDPDQWAYSGSLQWFNLMEGYLPRPEYPTQVPWIDPFTGEETKFPLSGNPVTSTGWIDGIELPPGDRKTVMSSGPFSLSLGGSADIVVGLIGGVGHTYLSSVDILKHHDAYAQWAYELNFDLPEPPPMPIVNAESFEEVFVIDWSANSGDVENMGSNHGYEFQGYNIYQLPYEDAPEEEFTLVETFDIIDLVQAIFDPVYDEETGFVIEVPVQFGSDNGIQRYFLVDWDYINDEALSIGTPYYFAVSAYNYCACPDAPVSSLESDFELIQIIPDVVPDLDYGSDVGENLYGEHSGTGNISLDIQVINPIELTGDDYMVSFAERDFGWNGYEWTEIVNQQTSGRDCSASTVTGAATWGVEYGTIDLVLTFDLVCQGSWVDGFEFNFPNDFSSYVNSWEITGGTVCSYGTGSGQNCDNLDGTWSGDVLLYGNNNVSGFGAFETGITFTLNVNPWYPGGEFTALQIDYIAYDDGYESLYEGGTTVNAQGTATIDAINEVIVSVNNWNLQNMSTGDYVLEYQTIFNDMQQEAIINGAFVGCCTELGMGANPIIDGFLISVYGSYVAPDDWHDWSFGSSYNGDDGESYFDLGSYMQHGWALTARAVDTWGAGITSVDILQRDIQCRFTGEFETEPITTDAGIVYYPAQEEGGSYARIDGVRLSPLADHPDPANPGDGSAFRIKIPFEVWDMEDPSGEPKQIDITIYDRMQTYNSGDTVYSFNPYDRMYTHFIHLPYQEDGQYEDIDNNLTWNVVWWDTQFNQGDSLTFHYSNPIQNGMDTYTFATNASTEFTIAKGDVNYDGEVNIADAVMLINVLLQDLALEEDAQIYAADYNFDQAINIADLVGIINNILEGPARTTLTDLAENAVISLPEEIVLSDNMINLPVEIVADGSLAALQLGFTYDEEKLEPMAVDFTESKWHEIEYVHSIYGSGKVVYLFYSMDGAEIPDGAQPIFRFRDISGTNEPYNKIELNQAVLANASGDVVSLRFGNRVAEMATLPETYALHPSYPNPFNPITNINYDLPQTSEVEILVYNVLGQQVRTLVNMDQVAGRHRVQWNGKNESGKPMGSGVYLIAFKANEFRFQRKVMLLK